MPLEVNEIGIQLRVRDGVDAAGPETPSTPVGDCGCSDEKKERQALVEECLRRVLQVLRARQER
ncbi:DUF5908 family protein [Myxococcus sp. K15C18031901]|uniref:DUF5908 family protein n=1 Tax=Myxococcus dinghuensis TaxID=2906761 RepID=UPI0020A82B2F|nr:DUF5908 family protein [Myxococcus dinghuensis]MCP3100287.1 DUF5908 family protein [Myxococcus dinghuensis]